MHARQVKSATDATTISGPIPPEENWGVCVYCCDCMYFYPAINLWSMSWFLHGRLGNTRLYMTDAPPDILAKSTWALRHGHKPDRNKMK